MYECAGVWVCGRAGVRVCECMHVWVCVCGIIKIILTIISSRQPYKITFDLPKGRDG